METDNRKWKSIEPGVWKFEKKGDSITGQLVNKIPGDTAKDFSPRYILKTDEGQLMTVWGSAIIVDRMQYIDIDQTVRITYDGETTNSKNQKVNKFIIEVADDDSRIDNTDTQEPDPVQIDDIEDTPSGVSTGADNPQK